MDLPGRAVRMAVWVAQVGRVPLLLLDADSRPTSPRIGGSPTSCTWPSAERGSPRSCCSALARRRRSARWGSAPRSGISTRATPPSSCLGGHGCSAMRTRIFGGAKALARAGADMVMTLHTLSPQATSGTTALALELIGPAAAAIDLSPVRLAELGRGPDHTLGEAFDLTAFGLRQAALVTAVSRLHGRTATATWRTRSGRMSARSRTGCTCRPGRPSRCARPSRQVAKGRPATATLDRPYRAEAAADRLPRRAADPTGRPARRRARIGR